jgi:predicted dehydrogenase
MRRRKFIGGLAAALCAPSISKAVQPDKIKIGQIGLAHPHARGKLAAIRSLAEEYEFIGVVEPDVARRKSVRGVKFISEEELLNTKGLEAVAVETRVRDLVPTAARVVDTGRHIHLDKPAGPSLPAFKKLVVEAKHRKLTLQMGYMLRYNPAFQFMFRVAREGWFGEIMEIDAMMGKLAGADMRRQLAEISGGGFFELACHILDSTIFILGKPQKVHGITRRTREGKGDIFADNQLAVLEFAKGTACLRCNHNDPFGGPRRRFQIAGTQGGMEIRPLESGKFVLSLDRARGEFKKGNQTVQLDGGRSYMAEFADLAKVIRGEKALDWSYEHDLTVHETLLLICGMSLE